MAQTRRDSNGRCRRAAFGVVLIVTGATAAAAQPIQVPARFKPPTTWADLAEAVDPAVVSIHASSLEKAPGAGDGTVDPFDFFFPEGSPDAPDAPRREEVPGKEKQRDPAPQRRSDSGGSGFLISREGLVVTNFHVIEGASSVKVRVSGRDFTAKIRGTDRETDLALLEINVGRDLPYLELGDSDAVRVGDWIMVIGNPLNLDKTVTTGVVSAKGRSIGISGDSSFENFIQTDAAINFGNSGGPLVDMQGRVVAIATAINWGAENIGFAVPSRTLREILPQLREHGFVSRGYLGVSVVNLDFAQAQAFGLTEIGGALVRHVSEASPGRAGGVEHGDVILTVDERKVATTRDLIDYVALKGPGATIALGILRNGQPVRKQVKLGERPRGRQEAPLSAAPQSSESDGSLGIQTEELSANARTKYGIAPAVRGVLVTAVAPDSPLYEQAVRPGCVIVEVNGRPVRTLLDLDEARAAVKSGSYLRLYVVRPSRPGSKTPPPLPFFAVAQVP